MNRKLAIQILAEKNQVILTCNGNSMRPIMAPGDALHIVKVESSKLRVDDAVFVKVNGNLQVHKISAIDKDRFQISNNKKMVNGWVNHNSIYGLCCQVNNRIFISQQELENR